MNVGTIKEYLSKFPDNLEVKFVKYPSHKPLGFWDVHEWYVCEKKYIKGPENEKFLAIMVEDE